MGALWKLRVPFAEAPPGQLDFFRFPWLASNEKLKAELGWQPRYTSRETFEIALRSRGKLAAAATESEGAPVAVTL
jgi:nucleoside-diphosphate-sugar epimerase